MKRNRNVGIVGIGQTVHSSHREEVNQPEMIQEAIKLALTDAGLTMADIDCIVHGNMELFEMIHQPDMWHVLGDGAYGKPGLRVTTGGTTGATLVCAADALVCSGLHEIVLAIGFEKLQEGHTTGGITNMADPLWGRELQTGALTGITAAAVMEEFGDERAKHAAMKMRVIMDQHAMKNPYAHRRFDFQEAMIPAMVANTPQLVGELRIVHMCSQSDGACAMIFASDAAIKKHGLKNPAWMVDHVTVHREETFNLSTRVIEPSTHRYAAQKLFARNGITDPRQQIDVFEMYDPSSWWGLDWLREFFLLQGDEHLQMVENGDIRLDGDSPLNPSGGVVATNPIGATAMIRVAEAALQIRGQAGAHQVKKPVQRALASGFGGTMWTVLVLLAKDEPQLEEGRS